MRVEIEKQRGFLRSWRDNLAYRQYRPQWTPAQGLRQAEQTYDAFYFRTHDDAAMRRRIADDYGRMGETVGAWG